jgi:hypothetical protein
VEELPTKAFLNFLLPTKHTGLTDISQCKHLGEFMQGLEIFMVKVFEKYRI